MKIQSTKRIRKIVLVAFLIISLLSLLAWRSLDRKLHIYFLDIGQGDSILIRTPDMKYALVDGGPDNTVLGELGEVMPFWERKIDLVILTHPDSDHITGLIDVVQNYDIGLVIAENTSCNTAQCEKWDKIIEDQEIKKRDVRSGDKFTLGNYFTAYVIWPTEEIDLETSKDVNGGSIVFKGIYGQLTVLFTGDIEAGQEKKIISQDNDIQSLILKAAHHGSKTSSTEEFLDAVNPKFVVVCVGKDNRFNHPSDEVIQKLEARNYKIYRTDLVGRIEMISDGSSVWFNVERGK